MHRTVTVASQQPNAHPHDCVGGAPFAYPFQDIEEVDRELTAIPNEASQPIAY